MRFGRGWLMVVLLLSGGASVGAGQPRDRARRLLESENYTATWGSPVTFAPTSELEIGDGNGHGGTLRWLRFRPGENGVDVLSIRFDEGWHPYRSKWPPDRAPVTVESAHLGSAAWVGLLRGLAVVDSAKLTRIEQNSFGSTSNDFWVYARLETGEEVPLDLDWAGYQGTMEEVEYAKPSAAVELAWDAVKELEFTKHELTDAERAWASAKFARDWEKLREKDFHWWVRERYIQTIGVVGDASALKVLRSILAAAPPEGKPRGPSAGRCVYYAINAVTRLTKKDVREKPVEEMDIEKTRLKVLELLDKDE